MGESAGGVRHRTRMPDFRWTLSRPKRPGVYELQDAEGRLSLGIVVRLSPERNGTAPAHPPEWGVYAPDDDGGFRFLSPLTPDVYRRWRGPIPPPSSRSSADDGRARPGSRLARRLASRLLARRSVA